MSLRKPPTGTLQGESFSWNGKSGGAFRGLQILVDNIAAEGLVAEHGFSVLIDAGGRKILMDTGQGHALEQNAAACGFELADADIFVLSHGHYDHTGAVDVVLGENPEIQVYGHPKIFSERFSIYPDRDPKEISMPSEQRLLVANLPDSHLHWVREPMEIAAGVGLTGPIPRSHALEDTGGPFFCDREGQRPDPIRDDMAMWIETPDGLLVVCGCCHSGLINTLDHIRNTTGGKRILGVIGGLHLKSASEERLAATVEALQKFAPAFMVPCHCTGATAVNYFRDHLDAEIISGFAGFNMRWRTNDE
ncbi:MBL fold metallo-hydrolase [Pontiella agarivorans]|uniref:MBL fold metallo-hydrolase n=1 Tax=Pontiella agarivorans TaxID=3038953 RepID=A0ABU5MV92_9BACT|nr:MBL fold metallo-hydrolase [Pontiella agarivorans]MDZ8118006.1 MBL fold metallo-hydrolase [Pontiella agarivorans]